MSDVALSLDPFPVTEPKRIGQILKLPQPDRLTEVEMARRVDAGFSTKSVDALVRLLGRARVVGPLVAEPTLRRARTNKTPLSKDVSERLYGVTRVIDAAGRAFHGDKAAMDRFLETPHPLLEGETPFDLARSNAAGAEAVLNLLLRADAGFAV